MRARARRAAREPAPLPDGPSAGRHHAHVQRRAVPAALEHVRILSVQPAVRRRRADARGALHPRGGPRREQHAARERRPVPPAASPRPPVLQHDRLPRRVEDGRVEPGTVSGASGPH